MQLYFIRHGESKNNALFERTGSSEGRSEDPELSPQGRAQAEHLARYLSDQRALATPKDYLGYEASRDPQNRRGFHLTHLYTSLMVRSVATGAILSRALGLPLVAWTDLHETGGIYLNESTGSEVEAKPVRVGRPGKNRSFFKQHYPELILPDWLGEAGWWNRPFEEREERPLRARRFLSELLALHGDSKQEGAREGRVAVISHGGFYNQVMAALLKLDEQSGIWFQLNNAAITRIDFLPDGVEVVYQNRLDYLPRELVT